MDNESTSLTDLLNDTPQGTVEAAPAVQEPVQEPEPTPPTEGPVRDEAGRFAAKSGVEDAGPPPDKLPQDDYKAIREEREKRQALQAELEALKQQFQQSQAPKAPPAPPPSIWEDEQGWQQHQQQVILSQADQLSRINASEMAARSTHADFQEMYDLFNSMAGQNPAVVQQAMADPHPWNAAYKIAKNYKTVQEIGAVDLADLEAKMRERLMAEMQQQAPMPTAAPSVPVSLTGERNVGSRSGPAWSGPTSLSDLLR